ncbi:hypothetical protein FNV43_RR04355 [Rhamnella rubrinervis]|uniref:Uncharacterized protein n=1 Tax=Rhamnella rubrinervis TaxID=2594499 RepID=A0A8K0HLR1_9ROSA|nr:hypothetical protein FNV43_RR04355 [Rhamnella rubrinervis]
MTSLAPIQNKSSLVSRLQVEEDHRRRYSVNGVKPNVIEEVTSTKLKFREFKGKKITNKFKKSLAPKGSCWDCGKPRQKAQDYHHYKDGNNTRTNQANINEVDENLIVVVSKINMILDIKVLVKDFKLLQRVTEDSMHQDTERKRLEVVKFLSGFTTIIPLLNGEYEDDPSEQEAFLDHLAHLCYGVSHVAEASLEDEEPGDPKESEDLEEKEDPED